MLYAQTYVTHETIMLFVSELMLHTKICDVQTYFTHEYEMYYVKLMLHNEMLHVQTYVTDEYMMSRVRTYVTYENV